MHRLRKLHYGMPLRYDSVRIMLDDMPTYQTDFKMGDQSLPSHMGGVVEKCTFCKERLDRGGRPRCVDLCYAHARYFGDLDDPESEISVVLSKREYRKLSEDKGTNPNVFYLV